MKANSPVIQRTDREKFMHEEKLPTISIALGDHFTKIQAQSTYRFGRTQLSTIDLIGADSPVIFQYVHPKQPFVLPPSLFVCINLDFNHAISASISPHLHHLTLEESFQLIDQLAEILNRTNWHLLAKRYHSWELLRQMYADQETDNDYMASIMEWRCGADEINVTLERIWQRGEIPVKLSDSDEDLFIVTINIHNEEVERQYND